MAMGTGQKIFLITSKCCGHLKIIWQPSADYELFFNLIHQALLQLSPMSLTPLLQETPQLFKYTLCGGRQ